MAITFYYGSGSPYAWKVWLVLEHKRLTYDLRVLSFQGGDTRAPEFHALNPRGKVPVLVDGGVTVFESSAIAEYLEDAYPQETVLPGSPAVRALIRQRAAEADAYLQPAAGSLMRETLMKKGDPDPTAIADKTKALDAELTRFEGYAKDPYVVGEAITLADFALYPHLAVVRRIGERQPQSAVTIPPRLAVWMKRIEAQPGFERTIPPHWKG